MILRFRGYEAAAELKPSSPTVDQTGIDGFRGYEAAAELKQWSSVRAVAVAMGVSAAMKPRPN